MCVSTFLVSPTASLHHGHDPGADGGIARKPTKASRQADVGSGIAAAVEPSTLPKFCCAVVKSNPVTMPSSR